MFKGKLFIFIGVVAIIIFIFIATRNVCSSFGNPTIVCETVSGVYLPTFSHDQSTELAPMIDPNQ